MKIKVYEATGPVLNYLVAKTMQDDTASVYFGENGRPMRDMTRHGYEFDEWAPSTDWAQGGPIIQREDIALHPVADTVGWFAHKVWGEKGEYNGPTPLIAAMRCYVTSKLGDEIDVPEGLLP